MPQAASLAAAISGKLGVQPELIEGSGGVFNVVADGALIFSKQRQGRFPQPGEIIRALSRPA